MVTAIKQCPRCGRYCIPYVTTSWRTEWKCSCGYNSTVNGSGVVYSYSTAATLTNSRTSKDDKDSRQIQKEGGVPSLEA